MRVLFAHRYFPGHYEHLARALGRDRAHRVVFVHEHGEGALPGVETVRVRLTRGAARETHPYVRQLEEAVLLGQATYRACVGLARAGFRPDVACAHGGWGPGLFLRDAFPGVPVLGYFEWFSSAADAQADALDAGPAEADDALRLRARNAGLLLELVQCDRGVCPTAFQRDRYPPELRHKLTVLHDGVDTEFYRPAGGPALADPLGLGLPAGTELVTYATRGLEPHRGFPQFMDALALLQPARPRLHAVVVGEDRAFYSRPHPSGRTYKALALERHPGLDLGRVHFLEPLPRHDYRALLRASSVHVYLTLPFVLSWSLVEAMACGCALVASDTEPVREALDDGVTALLADHRSPQALADRVARALDDRPLAARLGSAARAEAERRYGLLALLPRHLELLRAVADGRVAQP